MDDFFDFDEAAKIQSVGGPYQNISLQGAGPRPAYDIDMMLAEQASDDLNSFHSLQDFIDPRLDARNLGTHSFNSTPLLDQQVGNRHSFTEFPHWMNGAERPANPCAHCRHHGLECIIINSGESVDASICTSCVALSRHCSLPHDRANQDQDLKNDSRFNDWMELIPAVQPEDAPPDTKTNHSQIGGSNQRPSARNSPKESSENSIKSSARFSRETIRTLKNWASAHYKHPYPTEEEKEDLRRRTGLSKIQITNWLANARRRGLVKPSRSKSPSTHNVAQPIDIPTSSISPAELMNPMERWQNSPPEHEPASVAAIANAVTSINLPSSQNSPFSYPRSENGSVHSVARASSASSINSAHSSGGSLGSAFSRHSHGSFGSFGKRGRRRRRHTATTIQTTTATKAQRQYQCTFCIESFKTKHDWQRHEKSLHLSLERWICAPNGGIVPCRTKNIAGENSLICVFCGISNPDESHLESHNYVSCLDRSLEERTFYRKDHLRQHLRLVHGECKFMASTMDQWKIESPNIKSRCGFCGDVMATWPNRVDHLAEHFKAGKKMTEWRGGWGFDPQILNMVENATIPQIVHGTTSTEAGEPFGPYDFVKQGLLDFMNDQVLLGIEVNLPSMRSEGRRLVLNGAEVESEASRQANSWFKDLFLLYKVAESAENLQSDRTTLKGDIVLSYEENKYNEEVCSLERALACYVEGQMRVGLTPTNKKLQAESCRIIRDYDHMRSVVDSDTVLEWLCQLILADTHWLTSFRKRVGLPQSPEISSSRPSRPNSTDSSPHNQALEKHLANFVKHRQCLGSQPSDEEIRTQARLSLFGVDDSWNQTIADNPDWLAGFKRAYSIAAGPGTSLPCLSEVSDTASKEFWGSTHLATQIAPPEKGLENLTPSEAAYARKHGLENLRSYATTRTGKGIPLYSLTDAKCYYRLELELARYVASCISENSPNFHIPTDDELKHQARLILYNDDCPWNQTAVDNGEWLLRFKRSHGLYPSDGPGLPPPREDSEVSFGATGITPLNTPSLNPLTSEIPGHIQSNGQNGYTVSSGFTQQRIAVPTVFFSWELEASLAAYARSCLNQGFIPSDYDLRARARLILGTVQTAADEPQLLEQFKNIYGLNSLPQLSPDFSSQGMDLSSQENHRTTELMDISEPLEGLHFLDFNSHAQGLNPISDYDRITSLPSESNIYSLGHGNHSSHSSVSRTSSNSSSKRASPMRRPPTPKPGQSGSNSNITRNIMRSLSNTSQTASGASRVERASSGGKTGNLTRGGRLDRTPHGNMVAYDDVQMVSGIVEEMPASRGTRVFGWGKWSG